MELTCNHCHRAFEANAEQDQAIRSATQHGQALLMVQCPHCSRFFSTSPSGVEEAMPVRCPVSGCAGLVSKAADDSGWFWGCGECGSVYLKCDSFKWP